MSTPRGSGGEHEADEAITFSDGSRARLSARDDGWAVTVDGVQMSHLGDPGSPPVLAAVRWMLAAIGDRPAPLACAHLGGGLLTLPRAIDHRWPGSVQTVVEIEPALVELATTRFPAPPGVTVREGDARAWLEAPTASGLDLVTIDVFAGNRVPPAFTSLECMRAARQVLADDGRLVVNSVAGPELLFTRRQLATLRATFAHVALVVQGSALHGLRFGNATLVASDAPLDPEPIRAALAGDPSRGALVADLDPIIDGADPVRDSDQLWSPEPRLPNVDAALRLIDRTRAAVEGLRDATR